MATADGSALAGRTVLITGATRGIGRAAAEELASRGATVIVHGRDTVRVGIVVSAITARCGRGAADGIVADLASLADVRQLAAEVDARFGRLDVLINNAGLATRRRELTTDGFERQLAVNHLAPFLLTTLLLGKLKASAPARIVTVASNAHHRSALDLDDLNWERRPYKPLGAYGATKLANILFTRELARRLRGSGVTANCLHPGVVATHIFAGVGPLGSLFGMLGRPFMRSARAGAVTTVHLAAEPGLAETSGGYFADCQSTVTAPRAADPALASALWEATEQLVSRFIQTRNLLM